MSRVKLTSPFGKGTISVADAKAAERYTAAGWVKEGTKSKAKRTTPAKPEDDSTSEED